MKQEKKAALAEFHRNTIQQAAEQLFTEKGVTATSIDEIAKAAGYSKATIYVYFKGKADIWNNILVSAMIKLKEQVESALAQDISTTQRYFAVCEAVVEFSEEYPLYFESLLGAIGLGDDETDHKIFVAGEEIMQAIGQLIQQGIEEGVIRPDLKFPHITFIFWSCISGIIQMASQKEVYFAHSTKSSIEELRQYGFETLLNSITV